MTNDFWRVPTLLTLCAAMLFIGNCEGCHNSVTTEVLVFAEESPVDFVPGVSIALALATMTDQVPAPEPKPTPTPDGKTKCTNCDGRGKVGDGRTMIECPVCNGKGYTEPQKPVEAEMPVAPPVPETDDPKPKEPIGIKRVLMFDATWCGPCKGVKANEIEVLKSKGWRFGKTRDFTIQEVDVDQDPGAAQRYRIETLPTFVWVDEKGNELARMVYSGTEALYQFFRNVPPPLAPPAEEPPAPINESPIQTYEVPREWIPQPPPMTARERALQRYQQRKAELEQRRAERRARYGR